MHAQAYLRLAWPSIELKEDSTITAGTTFIYFMIGLRHYFLCDATVISTHLVHIFLCLIYSCPMLRGKKKDEQERTI